jgi:hypothetical protein
MITNKILRFWSISMLVLVIFIQCLAAPAKKSSMPNTLKTVEHTRNTMVLRQYLAAQERPHTSYLRDKERHRGPGSPLMKILRLRGAGKRRRGGGIGAIQETKPKDMEPQERELRRRYARGGVDANIIVIMFLDLICVTAITYTHIHTHTRHIRMSSFSWFLVADHERQIKEIHVFLWKSAGICTTCVQGCVPKV